MFEKISIWGRRRNIKGMGVDQLVIELEERGQAHVTSERTVFCHFCERRSDKEDKDGRRRAWFLRGVRYTNDPFRVRRA